MVLYTIIPLEYIFDTAEDCQENTARSSANQPEEMEIARNGITFMVQPLNGGQARINRMISSNAQDYLRPEWQPGSLMQI